MSIEKFIASPWFALGSNVVSTLISFVTGVLVTKYYSSTRQTRYQCRSLGLTFASGSRPPGLEIRYGGVGQSVDNVTVSRVAILNSGRAAIRKGDVLGKDSGLRVAIDLRYQILDAEVLQMSRPENDFRVTVPRDRKVVNVAFDHMERAEGVVIHVVHTGTRSRDLTVEGKYENTPIRRTIGKSGDRGTSVSALWTGMGGLILGFLLATLIVLASLAPPAPDPWLMRLPAVVRVPVVLASVAAILGYFAALSRIGRLPRGLAKYEEEF